MIENEIEIKYEFELHKERVNSAECVTQCTIAH